MIGPRRWIVTESVQSHDVNSEMVTKYGPIFLQISVNISLIYAILAIKHDYSIH